MHPTVEALLRCPRCHGALTPERDGDALAAFACPRCAVRYAARDGVVDFTPDAAEALAPADR
jgi:uncharacterized C2H2 Zn-finger protein